MKRVKRVVKKAIIVYIIIYLILGSISSSYARTYDKECGEYISQYARDFIDKYCTPTETKTRYVLISKARWTGGEFGKGIFEACCNTGIRYMYELALGVELADYGWANSCATDCEGLGNYPQFWEDVTNQTLEPGDIVFSTSHTEMYIGDNQNANFGNSPYSGKIANGPRLGSDFTKAYRPKFDVNPTGTIPIGELEDEDLSIYDDNGFIYKGVASIESYESSTPLGKWIINMLSEILDYLIGILTFGIRVVIVGWTAIIERFFIDGIVNSITGVTNKKDETWVPDPATVDEIDNQAQADEEAEEAEQVPIEDIGDESNPNEYVSSGMQQISKIGGNVQLKTSSKANVTIENIVYNKIPILDINFFNFESAGGAVVDEDGVIYIIKENVAMWYYIFRIMAILIMLLVLIYLGIKMAITTVSEKKAVYKEMLISWIAGFILVFAISYIMYAIIHVNESFISWVIPKYEDGTELSLYETVRTKAYSLKASTGFAGMIMYIVLVYYSIRFLVMYFKRFLTVIILAIMSPFVAVAYALEKVNKNGKGGEIYGNWFKDFLYSVMIQSIHALIYTLFISIILKLTEASLLGILLSFIFLGFMVRIDKVVRRIFGLDGKNTGKIALGDIKAAREIGKSVVGGKGKVHKLGKRYGNYLGNTVGRPFGAALGRAGNAMNNLRDRLGYEEVEIDPKEQEKRKKEQEARKERRQEGFKDAALGAKAGLSIAKTAALSALVIPSMIAEPKMSVEILNAAISSSQRTKKLFSEFGDRLNEKTKATTADQGRKYKLTGIKPKTPRALRNTMNRLTALGASYAISTGANENLINKLQEDNGENVHNLTGEQRRNLSTNDLHLLNNTKTVEEFLEETGDITKTEEYAELLQQAHALEKELESSYKQITGKIDEEIAEAERTVGREFAIRLQAKKAKELKSTAKIMSQPLSEKDIFRAMQNYKSRVPQFNPTAALSQADMEGITKEINSILQSKGESIIMSKDFALKVQKELTESQRRAKEEEARRKNSNNVGQDMSSQNLATKVNVQEREGVRLRDRVKEENAPDMYDPNSEENPNAPKQSTPGAEKESATERLVKNIVNTSKDPESKETTSFTPKHVEFAKNLDQLRQIGEKMASITGSSNEFNLDDIFNRLDNL